MKDAAEKTARKTAKRSARKVAEKVVDELVDRAKQSRSEEEKMPTPATPAASISEAIEKEGKPEALFYFQVNSGKSPFPANVKSFA